MRAIQVGEVLPELAIEVTASVVVAVSRAAYQTDRKPFLFRSQIWLPSDYGTTT